MVDRYDVDDEGNVDRFLDGAYVYFEDYEALEAKLAALVEAAEEVVRISDRKHDAWDKLKAAIKDAKEKP